MLMLRIVRVPVDVRGDFRGDVRGVRGDVWVGEFFFREGIMTTAREKKKDRPSTNE